jgi:hypothetical protein
VSLLVCFATSNRFYELLGFGDFGLEGCDPAVTLREVGSLESILVAVYGEEELDESFVCGLRRVGLERMDG